MFKIISNKKLKELKRKSELYDSIHQYLYETLNIKTNYKPIENSNGSKIYEYPKSQTIDINLNIEKLYDLIGIVLPKNIK